MNRILKEVTVLKEHLYTFVDTYNFAKRLRTLKGLTPYEFIIKCWQNKAQPFIVNPYDYNIRLNTQTITFTKISSFN